MLNVLICDDSGKQIILEKKAILDYQAVKKQALFRIQTTTTTKDALKYVASNRVDIAVLDIEIDSKTGIDVAKEILARNTSCKIIFVTNYDSFAYSAFEIEAFSYLLKPFEESRLCEQIDKILLEIQKEQLLERYGGSKLEMKFKGTTSCVRQDCFLQAHGSVCWGRGNLYSGEQGEYCKGCQCVGGAVVKKGSGLVTSKANREVHGFGMQNIKSAVEKYDGFMSYQVKDGTFGLRCSVRVQEGRIA